MSIAFARDISKRKRAQRYLTAHYAATCILAEADSLAKALPPILQAVCEALNWEAGAYWSVDRAAGMLRCEQWYGAATLATTQMPSADDLTCRGGDGLPGRVFSTTKPVWSEDIQSCANVGCQPWSKTLNLRGAFAVPILLEHGICGVLAFYSSGKQKQDLQLLDIMTELGKLLGHFIARKLAEDELQHSEERFRQLAENIHEVFWMADARDDHILYLSPSFAEVWGQPSFAGDKKGEAPRTSWLQFVHPDDRSRYASMISKPKQGENTCDEYRVTWPDGSVRWLRERAFPIRDESGQVYRIAGITADFTERRRTEEVLRETTQTLQALIHAAPVAIHVVDLAGRVRLWNPAASRIFGWTEAEILNQPVPIFCGSSAQELGVLPGFLQGESINGLTINCRTKDAGNIQVSLSAAPLRDATGETFGVMGILVDLTDQKRLEEQLRQAQKMEAVGQLAGGIAHDLTTCSP